MITCPSTLYAKVCPASMYVSCLFDFAFSLVLWTFAKELSVLLHFVRNSNAELPTRLVVRNGVSINDTEVQILPYIYVKKYL